MEGTGGNGGGEMESEGFEQETPSLDTSSLGGVVQSLGKEKPTAIVAGLGDIGGSLSEARQRENEDAIESLPTIDQPTGLDTGGQQEVDRPTTDQKSEEVPEVKEPAAGDKQDVDTRAASPKGPNPVQKIPSPPVKGIKNPGSFRNAVNSLPESDGSVNTNPGTAPKVKLTGDADPARNEEAQSKGQASVQESVSKGNTEASKDFREGEIVPSLEKEEMKAVSEFGTGEGFSGQGGQLPELDAQSAEALNAGILQEYGDELATHVAEQEAGEQDYQQQAETEQETALADIEVKNEEVKQQQIEAKQQGTKDINQHREEWKAENQKVSEEFGQKSAKKRAEIEGEIEAKVSETNAQVESEYARAETEAEAKAKEAQEKVQAKKDEARKKEEDKSWWERAVDAVANFFEQLKKAVSAIFDLLRAAVKQIIEKAKELAGKLIDMARDAIKGLIDAFAEALKSFIRLALAAFPELADKFCKLIDTVVEQVKEAVDKLAEGLKQAVQMLLDALGKAIDLLLSAYEALINGILSAIEALTVIWLKIMEGIANLVKAAGQSPDYLFWDEILVAMVGFNPTSPLPGIERTDGADAALDSDGVADPSQELLNKEELSPEDVEIDPILGEDALSPEVLDELNGMEEGEYPFEGVANPITMDDFRNPENGKDETDESDSGEIVAPTSGPDFQAMSDDDKLQWYLSKMETDAGGEAVAEGGEQGEKTSQSESLPDEMKVGPLSVEKRIWFFTQQMKIGIQQWWDSNKGWIIPSVIAAVLLAVVALIATGGAALMPIISALMTALTVVFGAVLVAQMAGHLKDYVQKAWGGDVEGGAVSLAKALAVGMVELIMNLIFKGIGKLLKSVAKGARSAVRGLKNIMRQSAQFARRVGRAVLANGKVVFKNVSKAVTKGIKKVRNLTQKLSRKLKLGKGRVIIQPRWILIELTFNPPKIVIRFPRRQAEARMNKETPFGGNTVRGFKNGGEIMERLGNLKNQLKSLKIKDVTLDDIKVGIRGSSVSGASSKGGGFRWRGSEGGGKPSDIDFFISSDKLDDLLRRANIEFKGGRMNPNQLADLNPQLAAALKDYGKFTTSQLGRPSSVYVLDGSLFRSLNPGDFISY